jgi:hypothetical protein
MAQRLHKLTLVSLHSSAFRHGYALGLKGEYRNDITLPECIEEDTAIAIVSNLLCIQAERWLTDELVRRDVGILVGWIVRSATE